VFDYPTMSTPMQALPRGGTGGLLRMVDNASLTAMEDAEAAAKVAQEDDSVEDALVAFIRKEFQHAKNNKNSQSLSERLINALRTYQGFYDTKVKAEISAFGGSDVYARVTSQKCRAATALLRDVYLSAEKPWAIKATPVPTMPENIQDSIVQLVSSEVQTLQQAGQQVDDATIISRLRMLQDAAQHAAVKQAKEQAEDATRSLDDYLVEGGFYRALKEFLTDLPIFPFAVLKGPTVRLVQDVQWVQGKAQVNRRPRMEWYRVSPFDVFFTPGASCIEEASVFERIRLTRQDLHGMMEVPGFDKTNIEQVLDRYDTGGLASWFDETVESERAALEYREDTHMNTAGFIDTLEFHGYVPVKALIDANVMTEEEVPDKYASIFMTVWVIDRWVIKAQVNPVPTQRVPYYVTSFEKVPGTMYGNGLPDILVDVQSVMNATLRTLVNNLAIASGPQVVIDEDRLSDRTDADTLYPWKRWRTHTDPLAGSLKPIEFYQPSSNSQELLGVYEKFNSFADEISAIPRYLSGGDRGGGASRTASGLAMLINNASKVMQNVASSIDTEVIKPALELLYDYVMLTDNTGLLRGDEAIDVRGVTAALQKEQDRVRQLEFLQLTGNPIDMQIIGPQGRAAILREVAETLGMDHEQIVPDEAMAGLGLGMAPPPSPADQAQSGETNQPPSSGASQQPGPDGAASDNQKPYLNNSPQGVNRRNTI
jgi:hypothetical protein